MKRNFLYFAVTLILSVSSILCLQAQKQEMWKNLKSGWSNFPAEQLSGPVLPENEYGEIVGETDPPDFIKPRLFQAWCQARRGTKHAQDMSNPVWSWLVRTQVNAYRASKYFSHNGKDRPGWCCHRFGQSRTELPDGRIILVAGEHEDYYDEDFFIYNDVIVLHPDNRIEIFGYPGEDFPPTDFHTATLVDDKIVLIGNLSYLEQRLAQETQVLVLDTKDYRIEQQETTGENPGWISRHQAKPEDRRILITGGETGAENLLENIDDWQLDLNTWQWSRLTDRQWPRFTIKRSDGQRSRLDDLRQAEWDKQLKRHRSFKPPADLAEAYKVINQFREALPDYDPQLLEKLYHPTIEHQVIDAENDRHNVHRILVQDQQVRYQEEWNGIYVVVEGKLPQNVLEELTTDLKEKLSQLEETEYEIVRHKAQ